MLLVYFILVGLCMSTLKVAIESGSWNKEKDERKFHGTGLAIVFVVLVVEYYITDYNWKAVAITWLVYWNAFEITNNLYHNKAVFYVGETANFDKFLRWVTRYHERLKFFLHLITLVLLVIISIYL